VETGVTAVDGCGYHTAAANSAKDIFVLAFIQVLFGLLANHVSLSSNSSTQSFKLNVGIS
jgi:hypothetical protein